MLKILVSSLIILAFLVGACHCFPEDAIEVEASDLDTYEESVDDTFIKIRVIDKKGKYPTGLEALKREFQCLDKIRPVLLICLEERVLKTLHLTVLLRPKCSSRIMKFKEWANNTCDGLIGFSVDRATPAAADESWFVQFVSWVRSVFRFFRGECKFDAENIK